MDDQWRPGSPDGSAADAAATFAAHLADSQDGTADRERHLRECPTCAAVTRELRAESTPGPDVEMRLLCSFHEWRDA